MFEHARHADAAQLLTSGGFATSLVEILEIGELERLVDDGRKVAAVVDIDRGFERHRRRRNEVFLAQPYGVHSDDARSFLDHPLKCVVRLRPAGTSIGTDRDGVAEVAGDGGVHLRNAVHAGQAAREIVSVDADAGGADVGALIAKMTHAQCNELTLFVEGKFDFRNCIARLRIGDEGFRPSRLPLYRPPKLTRRHEHRGILRVHGRLHAECASHIAGNHAQLLVRNSHDRGGLGAQRVGALRAGMQNVAVAGLVVGPGGAASFH